MLAAQGARVALLDLGQANPAAAAAEIQSRIAVLFER